MNGRVQRKDEKKAGGCAISGFGSSQDNGQTRCECAHSCGASNWGTKCCSLPSHLLEVSPRLHPDASEHHEQRDNCSKTLAHELNLIVVAVPLLNICAGAGSVNIVS